MKILVYPVTPDAFEAEEVECQEWQRIDEFTIGIVYYPNEEEETVTYQTWQAQDCPIEVKVVSEV